MSDQTTKGDRRDWDGLEAADKVKKERVNQTQPTLTKADIKQQKALRLQLCTQAIQQALNYYECDLVALPIITGGKIEAKMELVLK